MKTSREFLGYIPGVKCITEKPTLKRSVLVSLSVLYLLGLELFAPIWIDLIPKKDFKSPNPSTAAFSQDPNYLKVWGSLITEVSAKSQSQTEAPKAEEQSVVEAIPIPKPAWMEYVISETPEYDKNKKPIKQTILDTAKKYDIPAGLLSALLWWESEQFNQAVIDVKKKSPAGAEGISQFMPETAKRFGVNTKDPVSSIDGAGRYLQFLYNYLGQKWDLALAGYNSGEGTVKWWGKIPPLWETQKYVRVITEKYLSIEAPQK